MNSSDAGEPDPSRRTRSAAPRARRRARCAIVLTTALAATLLVPWPTTTPTAQASEQPVVRRSATISTLSGQPPEGMPRVTRVAVAQDVTTSTVAATVTWASAPRADDPSAAYVYLGVVTDGGCSARLGLAVHGGRAQGAAQILPAATALKSRVATSGTQATVTASGSTVLGTTAYTCAYALTSSGTATHQSSAWYTLAVERRKAPRLDVVVREPRVGATTTGWTSVKVRIDNDGDAKATGVVVRVAGTGIKASRTKIKVKAVAPGKNRTVTLRLRLTTARTRTATVTVTASGGHKDTAKVTVLPRKATTTPKSVSGRLFYGWDSSLDDAWQPRAVWFVDATWAFVGVPTKGRPACRSGVKGCVRYTYDRRTGKVKVGKATGRVTSKQLYLVPKGAKARTWYSSAISIPRAGSRYDARLVHQDASGCGYGYGKTCVTSTSRLRLSKDGRFSQARESLTSGGGWYVGGAKDEKGRYKVLSKGRIRFTYASGKVVTRTFGVMRDVRELPDAAHEGVLLGAVHYDD